MTTETKKAPAKKAAARKTAAKTASLNEDPWELDDNPPVEVSAPGSPSTVKRLSSSAVNAGLSINFDDGLSADDLTTRRASSPRWVERVHDLYAGILEGKGNLGTFYRIGQFASSNGVQHTIRALRGREFPFKVELRKKPGTDDAGNPMWELRAAITELSVEPPVDNEDDE